MINLKLMINIIKQYFTIDLIFLVLISIRMYYEYCTNTVRILYEYCTNTVRILYEYCTNTVRIYSRLYNRISSTNAPKVIQVELNSLRSSDAIYHR